MMNTTAARDYRQIPGTYVFDGEHCHKGYALNMFCKSLDLESNRAAFRADSPGYLDGFKLSDDQRRAVLDRDWLMMLQLGGNIYYTFKLAILDGLTMQHVGAAMSANRMSVDEFRAMMISGGRSITGNRSVEEWSHG
ncbi:protocatechuate 4,5-dioxygenase subunit alpha [Paraburkholderia aspalathi]|jgi:protocatechuate 4,5-dioxygenase alpha chain|uniref:protocatechuate 4,5-dioxygenase subunit alpha n=2 Tax=Paraburkholderia TaxID=1822464 RepID=UPI0038B987C2